jgi:hypothetical protein
MLPDDDQTARIWEAEEINYNGTHGAIDAGAATQQDSQAKNEGEELDGAKHKEYWAKLQRETRQRLDSWKKQNNK